ncbi:hypothetical protein BSKO_07976 [Bryopsis sp. KO-2023]|nr:hypothetical protein BSKO_07976 [Bryopsis sp. KO-2023]
MGTVLLNSQAGNERLRSESANACRPGMSATARLSIRKRTKTDVCEKFIDGLRERTDVDVDEPNFVEGIREHFKLLPTRYALDVNIQGLDVLNHKKLLEEARKNPESVAFQVRPVEVFLPLAKDANAIDSTSSPHGSLEGGTHFPGVHRIGSGTGSNAMLRPAFASSPNLQAMLLDSIDQDDNSDDGTEPGELESLLFFEITVGAKDQQKLLSKLSRALGDAGLNIREAHVFNTHDKFSLDVFVVDGWETEGKEGLEGILKEHFRKQLSQRPAPVKQEEGSGSSLHIPDEDLNAEVKKADGTGANDWEIDVSNLQITSRIAAGSFGNLYKGLYYGQEVAIKVIKDVQENIKQFQEFMQEVAIMRKVRHKNVVQFIGACTARPNLCILFEYMAGGSVHDHLRKVGPLRLAETLKLSLDVSRGMDYLHQMKIIHRDLKAANLLLDEHGNVKIGDFGVARIMAMGGCMTAETGTYRWMAPEVIEHRPYDCKADVFSFGVLLWELLTGQVPYNGMTPLQAAVGVVQKDLRPDLPSNCPGNLAQIMRRCWDKQPANRPSFRELLPLLQEMYDEVRDREPPANHASRPKSGLLSRLRARGGPGGLSN